MLARSALLLMIWYNLIMVSFSPSNVVPDVNPGYDVCGDVFLAGDVLPIEVVFL